MRLFLAAALLAAGTLAADTVRTKDGSTLNGKILKVDAGVIEIETAYAGVLKVSQASVASFSTDAPVTVRFKDGNTVIGTVVGGEGQVRVDGGSVSASASVDSVTDAWLPGTDSPEVRQMKANARKWKFEASVDVMGKSGNSDNFASSLGFRATLAGSEDKLQFYANYARAEQDSNVTADQARGGVDYQSSFGGKYNWYVREEISTDKIQGLDFGSNTAAGIGFDVIKNDHQVLTFRTGLGYRYESYENGTDISAAALDLAFIHDYAGSNWKLGNRVTLMPTIEDFGVFRLLHDSFYETPIAASQWKLRLGIANDYNSEPLPGKEKLDTTYYTKFVLGWE
jgi:putative salt-induced outer membrane protein YdiY